MMIEEIEDVSSNDREDMMIEATVATEVEVANEIEYEDQGLDREKGVTTTGTVDMNEGVIGVN